MGQGGRPTAWEKRALTQHLPQPVLLAFAAKASFPSCFCIPWLKSASALICSQVPPTFKGSPVLHVPQGVTAAPPTNIVAWLASVAAAVAVGIFIGSGSPQVSQLQAPSIPPMLQGTAAEVLTPAGKLLQLPAGSSPEAPFPASKDITLNSTMTMQVRVFRSTTDRPVQTLKTRRGLCINVWTAFQSVD